MKKASIYFHINNGGVTLAVEDNGDGPCIVLKATHFGHLTGRVSVNVKADVLPKVAKMFEEAASMKYSPDSCVAAETPPEPGNTLNSSFQGQRDTKAG